MNVRLEDVALRAGLSKATVSLALNGSDKINRKTRERVKRLALEMGYHPNPYALGLATKKSRRIGLIVPDMENVYYASLVQHFSQALNDSGYGLFIATSMNSRLLERKIVGEMMENRMDALLLAPVNKPNDALGYLNALQAAGIPALFVTSMYPGVSMPCVMCDLYGGMKQMMKALHARGRKRIALLSGPEGVYCLELRENGYRDAVRELGLGYERVLNLEEVTYAGARTLLEGKRDLDADAIVCVNDMMALGVVNALLRRGVKIPEEIAVAGYDDVIFSEISPVPIATVRQDLGRIASVATDTILDMLQGTAMETEHSKRELPCEVIVRESIENNVLEGKTCFN